jgi:hypothetical protein
MLVAEAILFPLSRFFEAIPPSKKEKREYLVASRAELRLLVDSVVEQVCGNLLGKKTRNSAEARRDINAALKGNTITLDRELLKALDSLLSEYHVLEDKTYIDYAGPMSTLLDKYLRPVVRSLSEHPSLMSSSSAIRLKSIV